MLDRLASGDLTKLDEIYNRTWLEALNFMSFWKVRDEYHIAMNKIQQQKYK